MGRILLVEDDLELATELRTVLVSEGHSAIIALNLDTALSKMAEQWFDLVITDIFLCAQNAASPVGGQLVIKRAVQTAQARNAPLPAIAMTGGFHGHNLADWVLDTAEELGAVATLPKPINEGDLLEAVRLATSQKAELIA